MDDSQNATRPFAFGLTSLFALIALVAALLTAINYSPSILAPIYPLASNCGGNSAALSACSHFLLIVEIWCDEHPQQLFRIRDMDSNVRQELSDLIGADWVHTAKFYARADAFEVDPKRPKQIVVVCDQAYNNVPQQVFWTAPATHAVGYSNGKTGRITLEEFANLDLRGFVELKSARSESLSHTGASTLVP